MNKFKETKLYKCLIPILILPTVLIEIVCSYYLNPRCREIFETEFNTNTDHYRLKIINNFICLITMRNIYIFDKSGNKIKIIGQDVIPVWSHIQ